MGVPAFFKWLTMRYPKVVIDAIEEVDSGFDINNFLKNNYNQEVSMPVIDNFYLDMNGIIHPCCKPINKPPPQSEEEMFDAVFEYTDKLIKIIKPKKILYMAIDGVAPRAKMNQQRSRRFRAALDAHEKHIKEEELANEWRQKGLDVPEVSEKPFDGNVITPGTDFMFRLAESLKVYIAERLQNDPLWKGLTVIFSDSSVPGEGEHKILEFIRIQRTKENYNPNTRHCIYGADADLIMLSLITHEPHFFIIRESLNENQWKKCDLCNQQGHFKEECKIFNKDLKTTEKSLNDLAFSIVKVHVVREYLELEFKTVDYPFGFDIERVIDDFVYLCFFVGNDFIPHLPSLKIREGAIDSLIYLYKKMIPTMDGYLVDPKGKINIQRTLKLFKKLALIEEAFFKKQLFFKERQASQQKREPIVDEVVQTFNMLKKKRNRIDKPTINKEEIDTEDILNDLADFVEENSKVKTFLSKEEEEGTIFLKDLGMNNEIIEKINKNAAENFKKLLKDKLKSDEEKRMSTYVDPVRLGESGWKERYYLDKFKTSTKDNDLLRNLCQSYIEGICWVYEYYYNGCPSWEWYFPFHYAPFVSDICSFDHYDVNFVKGSPFRPIEQLLAVLPPYSSHALPKVIRPLMHDPLSELADFYPSDIQLDINGHPYSWMGVNLLPFIDEDRIKYIIGKHENDFSAHERYKNTTQVAKIFIDARHNAIYPLVKEAHKDQNLKILCKFKENSTIEGILHHHEMPYSLFKCFRSPVDGISIKSVPNCSILGLNFELTEEFIEHSSQLIQGIIQPKKIVIEDNLDFIPKRMFKGDQAINLVKDTLGYTDNNVEQRFRHDVFDRSYNNNVAKQYDQREINILQKKRWQQQDMYNQKRSNYNREGRSSNFSERESAATAFKNNNSQYSSGANLQRNVDVNQPNPLFSQLMKEATKKKEDLIKEERLNNEEKSKKETKPSDSNDTQNTNTNTNATLNAINDVLFNFKKYTGN